MKKCVFVIVIFLFLFIFLSYEKASSWEDKKTHTLISEYAADSSTLRACSDSTEENCDYLKNVGIDNGLFERLKWGETQMFIKDWIKKGAELEDKIDWGFLALYGQMRASNHFHNPLKPWENAGLDDWFVVHLTGQSSLLWAQDGEIQALFPEGDWTWQKTREHYYFALTSEQQTEREEYFARTFRGLGHQMHLIQDKAVPYHVRNDVHPEEALGWKNVAGTSLFERWAKENYQLINTYATQPEFPSVTFDVFYNGLVPITQLIDTDQYDGTNPTENLAQGLAEYTNANFFSEHTIFAAERFSEGHRHYFPYPKESSTDLQNYINKLPETVIAEDGIIDSNIYIAKNGDGEMISRFVRPIYLSRDVYLNVSDPVIFKRAFYLDEECHREYTQKLIPRAVGYSAALLDYFFRGNIEISNIFLEPNQLETGFDNVTLSAKNISSDNEVMSEGTVCLVVKYEVAGQDQFQYIVKELQGTHSIPTADPPVEFVFDLSGSPIPIAATEVHICLVYKGQLGLEDGGIGVGYKKMNIIIGINAPEQYVYSIIDGTVIDGSYDVDGTTIETQTLKSIKAKIKNMAPDKPIQDGQIIAVAKYNKRIYYQPDLSVWALSEDNSSYSMSEPIDIPSLSSTEPTEFEFNFISNPIPVSITDLYLQVIFKGTIGNETDSTAIGVKDLNEPMHVAIINCTDRFYLDGVLRTAQEIRNNTNLLARVDLDGDGIASEYWEGEPYIDPFDYNIALGFSENYQELWDPFYTPLPPGGYGRIILLTDSDTHMALHHESVGDPYETIIGGYLLTSVTDQWVVDPDTGEPVFKNTIVYGFRGVGFHHFVARILYYPTYTGIYTADWPGLNPVPITP